MQEYRRVLMVAILAWSVSAAAVRAENEGSDGTCNALCRFWLGRGDHQKEAPTPPVIAAEAPLVQAMPQGQEPEEPPIVRMKRGVESRTTRQASPPLALQSSEIPVEEGQGGAQGVLPGSPPHAATAARPMDLNPDEATAPAEPVTAVRPPPIPPRRPATRSQQARSRRPGPFPNEDMPVSLSVSEPQRGARKTVAAANLAGHDRRHQASASFRLAKPVIAPAVPVARPSAVAALRPAGSDSRFRPPVVGMPASSGVPMASAALSNPVPLAVARPGPTTPVSVDAGSTSVGRTTPAIDATHLHDVAPGPRPAMTADSTAAVPAAAKRTEPTDPDEVLEKLKETILRSAQEAVKQSEPRGF